MTAAQFEMLEATEAEALTQAVPVGLDEFNIQPLVLVKTLLVGHEDGGFTGQPQVRDLQPRSPRPGLVRASTTTPRREGDNTHRQ